MRVVVIGAFSDFLFPAGLPPFPERAAVEDYLLAYAAAFDLLPLIRFRRRVHRVRPDASGGWFLTVGAGDESASGPPDVISCESADAVLVCTGIFSRPALPAVPGLESFGGQWLHSIDYRTPERFAGRHVLVVGFGSSAAEVTLSVRRGGWIVPRLIDGIPLDHRATRLSYLLPARLRERGRSRLIARAYARCSFDPASLWSRANISFDRENAPGVTGEDLLRGLAAGEIAVRSAISRIDGREVHFVDGRVNRPDIIILCTGYDLDFPFLPPALQPWREGRGLYRLVFPPHHPTLPFIGVCRVQGPIFPIVEMQARFIREPSEWQ